MYVCWRQPWKPAKQLSTPITKTSTTKFFSGCFPGSRRHNVAILRVEWGGGGAFRPSPDTPGSVFFSGNRLSHTQIYRKVKLLEN